MAELRILDLAAVADRAASALSAASGGEVAFKGLEPLSDDQRRNLIARATAVYQDGRACSVIVKATRSPGYDPNAEDLFQNSGLAKEWVATAFLADHVPQRRHGGMLLAGDRAAGILVFEDLGADLESLVSPLLHGTAADAEAALVLYADALARLHADTAGCAAAHWARFEAVFGTGRPRPPLGWRVEKQAQQVADRIGGELPLAELELLSARLDEPGGWQSLVHGDPCPDNALVVGNEIRLIDYEFARPAHALLDGIYWRIGFPTCWCAGRVPADVARRIDAVYRNGIEAMIPPARDEAVYRVEMAHMAAVWLFTKVSWRLGEALQDDRQWGTWSVRGRLLWYLEAVIDMTSEAQVLPGVRMLAAGWLAALKQRWPDAQPLGLYPAFERRNQHRE